MMNHIIQNDGMINYIIQNDINQNEIQYGNSKQYNSFRQGSIQYQKRNSK